MFQNLLSVSLNQRLFVVIASVLIAAYGMFVLPKIPVDVFPDLNRPTVTLLTEADGLAPQEVEQLVTFPIETALNGLSGVMRLRSVSAVGLSIVYVEFDWQTDIFKNRQLVSERLAVIREQLPDGLQPQMGPITSIMGEILLVAITGTTVSSMELREIADWVVRPQILTVPGIAQVIPIGGEVRQYRVSPNLTAMQRLRVTEKLIEEVIRGFASNTAGGFIDQNNREYLIRNIGRTTKLDDLRNLVVDTRDGQPILLRQVADVGYAARVKRGDAGYQGGPAVIVSVQKQPDANTVSLTQKIEAELAQIQKTLPEGVRVDQVQFRQATFIENSIANVKSVLLEAAVIVALVLMLFLMNWRATFISLTAIPLSICVTVLVFKAFGFSINTMTLGGLAIAIGELVDDAVVGVENVMRRLAGNAQRAVPIAPMRVILEASHEVRSSIIYATLIVVLVFVPLFAMSGLEGRLFQPLGIAYIVSILASLIVSITLTPVLCYYLLRNHGHGRDEDTVFVRWIKRGNDMLVRGALSWPRAVMASIVVAFGIAALAAASLPRSFLPAFNEGTALVSITFNPGISLAESNRLGAHAEKLVLRVPEVASVGRRTGRAELDEHAEGIHNNELDIDLKPSRRARAAVLSDIRATLSVLPATINIGQPISHRLDHMLSGVRAQIAVKIFGDDLLQLRRVAATFEKKLRGVSGLVDLQTEKQVLIPQLQVRPDYERAALYGVTPSAITEALAHLANGRVMSQVIDGSRRFDVVLRLKDADRTVDGLRRALVATPLGYVPLRQLADVSERRGPNQILRENQRRRLVLFANTDGVRDVADIVSDIRGHIADTQLPAGMFARVEGQFKAQEDATKTIALLASIALALIFLVLYSRYKSFTLAAIVLTNIPLALIGSVAALWIADLSFSLASLIGFITLAGIAARNGILKISHFINLSLHEGEPFGQSLVLRGARERVRPVLMTALTAGLALIPLMIGADVAGREILHPLAVTIFGGLVSATLLDAVLTPLLFLKFGERALEKLKVDQAAEPGTSTNSELAY